MSGLEQILFQIKLIEKDAQIIKLRTLVNGYRLLNLIKGEK